MYTSWNFRTKKALKDAIASGQQVTIDRYGYFNGDEVCNGKVYLEGPHYPEPHKWYAEAWVENDIIVKVK